MNSKLPSTTVPDWSRETKSVWQWSPSRSLLASLRAYDFWTESHYPLASMWVKIAVARHRFWSVITGAEISLGTKIAGGLLLPHPNGVVIHPDAEIGPNCLIFQQVTLGADENGAPTLEGNVDVGAGAKVLGKIRLGSQARVGANAVVTKDVGPGETVVGVPARPISNSSFAA